MKLAKYCIYTIANREWIDQAIQRGEGTRSERKAWTTGLRLFNEARAAGERMPILLADSIEDCWCLLAWGILEKIEIGHGGTTFSVSGARRLNPTRNAQDLVLAASGKHVAEGFRRPYAICNTPRFLALLGRKITEPVGQESLDLLFDEPVTLPPEKIREAVGDDGVILDSEGLRRWTKHFVTERSAKNRKLVLEYFRKRQGLSCMACGTNLAEQFGPAFAGLVDIHHLVPVSREERTPRPKDFAVLCPTCHRMAHWKSEAPRDLSELRTIIANSSAPRRRLRVAGR
ncbi:MAG TPA: hypothetical protein DFS52_00160 [Myxococcales bacterium]|jgi:hypothetical protein|nr:hypothetical protein [Myxococcales bacterium]